MVVVTEFLEGSSSSSSNHDYRYDVFLSFRGADTRLGFTDHLYKALKLANYETFLDDEEMETGLSLKPELESAIRASRASIIVLSKNYASSTWCLNELVLILEQQRNFDQIVIPIFYHVEPTDVRKQQNSFGDAMAKHKQRMEVEADAEKRSQLAHKMDLWKKALVDVADLKGKDAKGRHETEFIEDIITNVYRRLGLPLRSTLPNLVGMEYSIEFITSWLTDGSSHTADILTIVGMGGIGKTSLAVYVYGLHHHEFHTSSIIEDISRRCADKFNGLLSLQKQLCGDISKTSLIQVHDKLAYTSMIENAIVHKKVFIVLDDIDSVDQLHALLGKKGFYPGSKIIITTKDASLTEKYAPNPKVQPKHTKHLLEGLHPKASLELLCNHAFKCNNPKEGYEAVLEKLLAYCEGHPLALKVLGESLQDREVTEWEECIQRLTEETDSRIKKALEMSFVSMPSKKDQELFKHIACFFVGEDRVNAETILKACGYQSQLGIKNLIDRCLLSIGWYNTLMMHQLLQEMGRDMVRQESPDKPWKRSRLWCHEETVKVLKQKKGTENLLGLTLDMRMLEQEKLCGSFELDSDALSKMDSLKLLQLNYVQVNGSYVNFPKELRWLCMHGFPLKSIPLDSPMENLVGLDMSYSNIESFDMSFNSSPQPPQKRQKVIGSCSKEKRLLGSLKILNLSFCEQLHSLGGFLEVPALERLILENCRSLIKVFESIEHCAELILIDLRYCNKIEKLPRTLSNLKKLETLLLDGCDLSELPIEMRDMHSTGMLKGKNIGIKSQTSSSAIVKSIMPNDSKFFAISLPSSMVRLSLKDNNLSSECFPMDFSCLSMLKDLNLDGNPIVSLPNCVRSLPRLDTLSMDNCEMLTSIEHPPCTLSSLTAYIMQNANMILLRRIVFGPEMSLLNLGVDDSLLAPSSFEIEGMIKIQPMGGVEEKVLHSLGWTNLQFLKQRRLETLHYLRGNEDFEVQMYYEFGIFSTIYGGEAMPNWISNRRKEPSISFAVPSYPKKLRGLNLCCVHASSCLVPCIKISNITKNRTWIYQHYIGSPVIVEEECIIYLSHWMFGMTEMEGGDDVTITIGNKNVPGQHVGDHMETRECGMSLVYDDDDGNTMEEDVLGYYKSWNHIIGGDLSGFLFTGTGEYILRNNCFFDNHTNETYVKYYRPVLFAHGNRYKDKGRPRFFRALCQSKST